jgi:3-deoxy-D-manno-octulosonic-acid transferase
VLAAHLGLARAFPSVRTVIVPHHPKRAFEIAQIAAKMGLKAGLRGGDHESAPLPEIYIAQLSTESGLFYRAASVAFMGKSLYGGSGKNPIEAARLGCAILHGPDVEDFEDLYRALDNGGGGALVFDAETLAEQLALLFSNKTALRAMGRAAAAMAEESGGASERIIQALAPHLAQAMVETGRGRVKAEALKRLK